MNYTYMKVFYTVAKNENISLAAKELDVTQPAVSRIISNIEEQYQTKLFLRSKQGVKLTSEGLALFEMIKGPLVELEKIEYNITNTKTFKDVTIHIGATATALYCYLFKHMEGIKRRFPTLKFRMYTGSSEELLNMVKEGSIDLAFITTPFKVDDDIEICDVFEINTILVAPISYKDKIKGPVSIKELSKYPFILLNKNMQFREHINQYFADHKVKVDPIYEPDSSSVLMPFVENDCGLTFIPIDMAIDSIKEGKCFQVDLIEKLPGRYVSFIIKKDKVHANIIYEIRKAILESIG